MTKNQEECIEMICYFPIIYNSENKSPRQIYSESNYELYYQQISVESILRSIKDDPNICQEWLIFSLDKRHKPAWAFQEKEHGKWSISYIQTNGKPSYIFIYEDKLLACAHLIKIEMEYLRILQKKTEI